MTGRKNSSERSRKTGLSSVFPVIIGFLVIALIILLDGGNPAFVFYKSFKGAVFTRIGILQTLAGTTPILLTSLTFTMGYRCGLFNIGAEGAMLIGAAATVAVGGMLHLPPGLHQLAVLVSAAAGGMLWSIPVAFLKVKRQVHEVVSTIMMNWTALFLIGFLISWPLRDIEVAYGTYAVDILPSARFPVLVARGPLTAVLYVGILAAFIVYVLMWHTRSGQHIRATGYDIDAARSAGINTPLMMTLSFAIGGASAGIAGSALTAGMPPLWTVTEELSGLRGVGFMGIAVAMIGRNHPVWCIMAAFFVSTIKTSRFYLQQIGIAPELTDIFNGIIVFSFALPEIYRMLGRGLKELSSRKQEYHHAEAA